VDAVALANSILVVIPPRLVLELLELDTNVARSEIAILDRVRLAQMASGGDTCTLRAR